VLQLVIAVIFVMSFLVGCGTPTTGTIEGKVYRSDMMEPIPNATVELHLSKSVVAEATTDEQGNYSFSEVKPDTAYLLSVVAIFKNKNASPCIPSSLLAENRDGLLMGVKDNQYTDGSFEVFTTGQAFSVAAGEVVEKNFDMSCK
jgi:hypothetical protein